MIWFDGSLNVSSKSNLAIFRSSTIWPTISITSHKKRTCPDVSRRWKMETITRCDSLDAATRRSTTLIHDGTMKYYIFTLYDFFYFCISTGDKRSFLYLLKNYLNYRGAFFEVFISIMQLVSFYFIKLISHTITFLWQKPRFREFLSYVATRP